MLFFLTRRALTVLGRPRCWVRMWSSRLTLETKSFPQASEPSHVRSLADLLKSVWPQMKRWPSCEVRTWTSRLYFLVKDLSQPGKVHGICFLAAAEEVAAWKVSIWRCSSRSEEHRRSQKIQFACSLRMCLANWVFVGNPAGCGAPSEVQTSHQNLRAPWRRSSCFLSAPAESYPAVHCKFVIGSIKVHGNGVSLRWSDRI